MNEQPPPMQNQQPNKERYSRPVPNEQDGFFIFSGSSATAPAGSQKGKS